MGNDQPLHTTSVDDSMRLLVRGISDVAVAFEREGDKAIRDHNYQNICKIDQALEITLLYHALNKRHADIALRLTQVLRDMESKGELKQIWKSFD